MGPDLLNLTATVQHNCDVSDAQFAGDYTMCTYLLKMREFYRWEQGIDLGLRMDNRIVGEWVERREQRWARIHDAGGDYRNLDWEGRQYAPFAADQLNQSLTRSGYVYGGGYGRFGKPHFFIAELSRAEALEGYQIWVTGREFARELVAPPAMAQGRTIYVRRESLRRMLWERIEEWGWRKRENALARAIGCYSFDADRDGALEAMTENETETAILHEIGELVAGELHFHFANMSPLRREIFPALNQAYARWLDDGDARPLKRAVRDGKRHWLSVTDQIMETYRQYKDQSAQRIESLVTQSHF